MSSSKVEAGTRNRPRLSLDTWAVILALVVAVLIRFGIIPKVPW